MTTLVDTDVLIAHLRGDGAATEFLLAARRAGPVAISVLTITEITGGMRSNERAATWRLLDTLDALSVTDAIAQRAGEFMRTYRRSHQGIGIADCIIAASAESIGVHPATLNVKHYPMFPGLAPAYPLDSR